MDNINQIFGAKQFFIWLLCSSENLSKDQALEKMHHLVALNNQVWKKIGDNVKKYDIDSCEQPAMFDFNPFLWIKYCFSNKDKSLLEDVVTLYSSMIRRLKEIVNLDPEVLESKIANDEPIHFSDIRVGKYTWSSYVRKAYEKFEKALPRPSRTNIINWEVAWSLYVRCINGYCIGTNLNSQMSEILDAYKDYLDPLGTEYRDRPSSKSEREHDELMRDKVELMKNTFVYIDDIFK